jgi:DNA-binding response OmpR family regulator
MCRSIAGFLVRECLFMRATILLIDDDVRITTILGLLLRKRGYDVLSTTDPRKVSAILDVITPSLIIIDYMMPEINGIQLTRTLRQRADLHHVPIYMLSSLHDLNLISQSINAGVNAWFTKDEMTGRLLTSIEVYASNLHPDVV